MNPFLELMNHYLYHMIGIRDQVGGSSGEMRGWLEQINLFLELMNHHLKHMTRVSDQVGGSSGEISG